MSKWFGKIGYANTIESSPGVWVESITERPYYGDVIRNTRRLNTGDRINDDISIFCQISVISDPYALQNFHSIRYAEFMNSLWKVTSVDVQYPRLIFDLGGVYNGPRPTD